MCRQLADVVLTHLVAARTAHQQCDKVGLLHRQRASVVGLAVGNRNAVQLKLASDLIDLMQFQPQAVLHRAVKLVGANQRAIQAMQGALQGGGEQRGAIPAESWSHPGDDLFIADRQMVLQGLAQVGDLARALLQYHRLIEEVPLQMLAHERDFRAQQLQQLHAVVARSEQLVEFTKALVQLTGHFAEVGFGQRGNPALHVLGRRVTERQARLRRHRCAQQQWEA